MPIATLPARPVFGLAAAGAFVTGDAPVDQVTARSAGRARVEN